MKNKRKTVSSFAEDGRRKTLIRNKIIRSFFENGNLNKTIKADMNS